MSLTVTVPDDIASAVEALSQQSGETPEQLVIKALLAHFPPIPAALQEEFDALETASDADAAVFEASLR